MTCIERKASEIGADKKQLCQRLSQARAVLTGESLKAFGQGQFQFEQKRLVSDDGTWALVWQIREHPDYPVSYGNQQTSIGYVGIRQI